MISNRATRGNNVALFKNPLSRRLTASSMIAVHPLMPRLELQFDAGGALEVVDDGEEVAGVGVAAAAEHAQAIVVAALRVPARQYEWGRR
jgi:hypothetical protein